MQNRFLKVRSVAVIVLLAAGLLPAQVYVKPADVAWETILSGPPAADSDQQKQDLAKVLEWQNKRTATDVARCKSEEKADPFIFSEILGDKFKEESLPVTSGLLKDAASDVKNFTKLAKQKWDRKRPPAVDEQVKPCVAPEANASYPSAHATRGVVWARILAEIFPDKKDLILERGKQIGQDRVIAGIHFPSDVEAGQQLGDAIADQLLKNPGFQATLAEAKDECAKAAIGK